MVPGGRRRRGAAGGGVVLFEPPNGGRRPSGGPPATRFVLHPHHASTVVMVAVDIGESRALPPQQHHAPCCSVFLLAVRFCSRSPPGCVYPPLAAACQYATRRTGVSSIAVVGPKPKRVDARCTPESGSASTTR